MEINKDILTDEGKILFDLNNIFINKNRKIEQLNNIIDELEKDLKNKIEEDRLNILANPYWLYVLNKLNELKGDNK